MMVIDRRSVTISLATAATLLLEPLTDLECQTLKRNDISLTSSKVASSLSVQDIGDVVECICKYTPTAFRAGVRRSGGSFLYRGGGLTLGNADTKYNLEFPPVLAKKKLLQKLCAWTQNPTPDLLSLETYNDPMALNYFECLERRLSLPTTSSQTPKTSLLSYSLKIAKPSNGHIGTSDPQQAGQWGDVVSVWPLGNSLSYVWPRDRTVFFPYPNTAQNSSRVCNEDSLVINNHLANALEGKNREIMFTSCFNDAPSSVSAFLAFPIDYDSIIRTELEHVQYGLL